MRVVDTSIIVERLTASSLRNRIEPYIPTLEEWLVPTMVQFELAKWLFRTASSNPMRLAEAMTERRQIVPLTSQIAAEAARAWDQYKLATADAIIYATARTHRADLLTCDRHFEGLPDVIYLPKPPN